MTFSSNREIKATRKEHRCEACGHILPIGSPASYWAGNIEGDFYACYYHAACREAEIALNDAMNTWGEDWISLCVAEDEERDWLRENRPEVAALLCRQQP